MVDRCIDRHDLVKGKVYKRALYIKDVVWCTTCSIGFIYQGLKCPCCHMDVRVKPRKGKSRAKRLEVVVRY